MSIFLRHLHNTDHDEETPNSNYNGDIQITIGVWSYPIQCNYGQNRAREYFRPYFFS